MSVAVNDIISELQTLSDDNVRARNSRSGAGDNQFGVPLGAIRKVAAKLKTNHELALALWGTGNMDARLVAVLVLRPERLSPEALDSMVRSVGCCQVADWLISYVVKKHPGKESLRQLWMHDADPWAARAGWSLTAERIAKDSDGLDPKALLDRLEAEMGTAAPEVQWTMNYCLAEIGIHFAEHRQRAIAIGEKLGVYRDYPVSKGCTSPFAPIWIREMVRRQG